MDVYEAMSTIGCSIMLETNHRAGSQCIVDNACRISEQKFPDCDSSPSFVMIRLPDSSDEESLSNGWFGCVWYECVYGSATIRTVPEAFCVLMCLSSRD